MKKIICAFLAIFAFLIAAGTVESNILICIAALAVLCALIPIGGLTDADD